MILLNVADRPVFTFSARLVGRGLSKLLDREVLLNSKSFVASSCIQAFLHLACYHVWGVHVFLDRSET